MKFLLRSFAVFVTISAVYIFVYWVPYLLLPLPRFGWIHNIVSLLCALGVGRWVWSKSASEGWSKSVYRAHTLIPCIFYGAIVFGSVGFVLGFFGPLILTPDANQGPLLGIFITGPAGFLLGAIIGLVVGIVQAYSKAREVGRIARLVPIAWHWVLWSSGLLAGTVIIVGLIYPLWHKCNYSHIVNSGSDLQRRDESLTSLRARSLSDDEIMQLQKFSQLNYIDFHGGWRVKEAKITDLGLKNLSGLDLPRLECLMLGYCDKITDNGMQYVAKMKNLKYLSLVACPHITDNGLAKLTSSSRIETLDLRGCEGITDQGLGYLKGMKNLKEVMLGGCNNVTNAGMEDLRKALPACKIQKDDQEWAMHKTSW